MQIRRNVDSVEVVIHQDNAQHTRKYVTTVGKRTTSEVIQRWHKIKQTIDTER